MLQGIKCSDPVQLADNLHRQIDKVILIILQGIITKKILISYYIYLQYMMTNSNKRKRLMSVISFLKSTLSHLLKHAYSMLWLWAL